MKFFKRFLYGGVKIGVMFYVTRILTRPSLVTTRIACHLKHEVVWSLLASLEGYFIAKY